MQLVYRYALATPHENYDLVEAQMRAAHRYRNVLTEIERGRRAAIRLIESEAGDMPAAMAALTKSRANREAAVEAITRHRAKSRKRDVPTELRMAAKAARQAERDAAHAFRELRRVLAEDPKVIAAKDAIGERAKELLHAPESTAACTGARTCSSKTPRTLLSATTASTVSTGSRAIHASLAGLERGKWASRSREA